MAAAAVTTAAAAAAAAAAAEPAVAPAAAMATAGLWQPALAPSAARAWATLLIGNSVNYTAMVLVQARTVRRFSRHSHVTLVTPDVNSDTRARLAAAGSRPIEVAPLHWRHMHDAIGVQWRLVFTKLHVFNLTEFAQVAFLDADAFANCAEVDQAFAMCPHSELCGVRDFHLSPVRQRPMVNAGLLVVRPSARRFAALLAARDAWVEPQARLPEQEFLSEYFLMPTKQDVQRAQRKTRGRFRSPLLGLLPERWNSCRHLLHALSPAASAEEVAALDHTCVVHACAGKKLNRLPLCMWAPRRGAAPFCNSTTVRHFQRLFVRDHPCAVLSRQSQKCTNTPRCHWCTAAVRCTERAVPCEALSDASKALEARFPSNSRGGFGAQRVFKLGGRWSAG